MNKKILLFLLLVTLLACSAKTEKPMPERHLEGWAGNPDNPNEEPFDYYYMKSMGRSSQKSMTKKNGEMMKTTCIDAATTKVKGDLIGKIIKDCSSGATPIQGKLFLPFEFQKFQDIDDIPNSDIASQTELDLFNAINLTAFAGLSMCEKHNYFVCELAGSLGGVGIKECKPLANPIPSFPNSEWKECECIVYILIKGGRERVIKDLELMDKPN